MKYCALVNNEDVEYVGKDQFEVVTNSNGRDYVVARVSTSPIEFIREFVNSIPSEMYLLYILKIQCTPEWGSGRYQSPLVSKQEALEFLDRFGTFLASDGRHDFWLYWPDQLQLVYDRHERFFLYGNVDTIRFKLIDLGLKEEPVEQVSAPHSHYYNEEFSGDLDDLLNQFDWQVSPLRETDGD